MKFGKLINKLEQLFGYSELDRRVKPEELEKLQQLLSHKISRYEAKLAANPAPTKKSKLETRLKVVHAQLEKSRNL